MIFVDANVFMYVVGTPHPLHDAAREFLVDAKTEGVTLVTSAEVVQELAHSYFRVERFGDFDDAISLMTEFAITIWPLEAEDVLLARELAEQFPRLQARDLCYLASCQRRGVTEIMTFDEALAAVTNGPA